MNNERDTWWLVERRGCQLWATGRGSFHSLTNDATRAERFASKFDAEEEIRCAEDHFRDELVATEHKFIGAVDPEGTNAQLLANALSRAEKAEARISSLQSSIRMAMDDVPGWYDSCIAALNLPDISAVSDHASQKPQPQPSPSPPPHPHRQGEGQ